MGVFSTSNILCNVLNIWGDGPVISVKPNPIGYTPLSVDLRCQYVKQQAYWNEQDHLYEILTVRVKCARISRARSPI